ncbi:MAG: glucosaminidase domain-containing protein, partial [Bacteroidota bacterium]
FRLACTSDWKGPELNVNGRCYRAYQNAFTSFRDHSLFVTSGVYTELRELNDKDYKSWANALEEKNYRGVPALNDQLLSTINKWQLFRFDG